jgi:putative acetyltransferase
VITIRAGGLEDRRVQRLLADHATDMYATSPAESVHALDLDALRAPGVAFWSAWDEDSAVGCGALKTLDHDEVELKSMRTAATARGKGVGTAMVRHLLDEARRRGSKRVLLETGSQDFFAPARRLYERHGFSPRGPFADYVEDPHARFYELVLR